MHQLGLVSVIAGAALGVAGVAIYVPRRRHRLVRARERAAVYAAIWEFLDAVEALGQARPEDLYRLFGATREERMAVLFGERECAHVAEIRMRASALHALGVLEAELPDGQRKAIIARRRTRLLGWMEDQRRDELPRVVRRDRRARTFISPRSECPLHRSRKTRP